MKKKYYIFLFLALAFTALKAQFKTITVVSQTENQILSNVLVYHKNNLIGETDIYGKVTLKVKNIDSLSFVKNGFQDIILPISEVKEIIRIIPNNVIVLKEVQVNPINPQTLLKRVADFMNSKDENGSPKTKSNYNISENIQVYNKFMADNDTLHYLNNRFAFENGNFLINNKNKIIKNFSLIKIGKNIYKSYSWNRKSINFPVSLETPLGIHSSVEFTNFFYHQNLFEYKIEEDENYIKLSFKQNKKSSFSNIEGYLIIDRFDYGIYEFNSKLLNSKSFYKLEMNFSNSKFNRFKILTENYNFKYIKQDNRYILDNCNKSTTFIVENVNFKNISFSSTIQVEKTNSFLDKDLKKYDMFNWEFK